MKILFRAMAVALASLAGSAGIAATIDITATGFLSDTSASFPSILRNGDPIRFDFHLDTTVPDSWADPNIYIGAGGHDWNLEVGGYSAFGTGNSYFSLNSSSGLVAFSGLSEYGSQSAFGIGIEGTTTAPDFVDGGPGNNGAEFGGIALEIILDNPTQDLFQVVKEISEGSYSFNTFVLYGLDPINRGDIAFRYFATGTSVAVAPIPLPASLPLMLAGLAGLGWVGRRRSSHRE